MPQFVEIAKTADVPDECAACVEVGGRRIAVFNLGGEYFAIDDACTHKGGSLSEGTVSGEQVICPWHGAHFNIKTGVATLPPARKDLGCYKVRVNGGVIEIEI